MRKGFVFDESKSPELKDGYVRGEAVPPGYIADFAKKSPELKRGPMKLTPDYDRFCFKVPDEMRPDAAQRAAAAVAGDVTAAVRDQGGAAGTATAAAEARATGGIVPEGALDE